MQNEPFLSAKGFPDRISAGRVTLWHFFIWACEDIELINRSQKTEEQINNVAGGHSPATTRPVSAGTSIIKRLSSTGVSD